MERFVYPIINESKNAIMIIDLDTTKLSRHPSGYHFGVSHATQGPHGVFYQDSILEVDENGRFVDDAYKAYVDRYVGRLPNDA